MTNKTFIDGDRIMLHRERGKWRAELVPAAGGVVAPGRIATFSTPEDALAALRETARNASR